MDLYLVKMMIHQKREKKEMVLDLDAVKDMEMFQVQIDPLGEDFIRRNLHCQEGNLAWVAIKLH